MGHEMEELLSQEEYQELDSRLADLSQELVALAQKTKYRTRRNHELERNLNGAAASLDQLRQNLEREFGQHASSKRE
jgi:uncharacterized membrane-anchored protein YhcB (DUF1043 family)